MRAYENDPWLRRATLHNIHVRGLPAQLCAILLVRPAGTTITSPTPTIATVIVDIVVAIIQPHDLDHPFGALIPSRRWRSGDRPAAFLTSIRATPGPRGNSTSARAVARCALSAAQWSPVEPALFSVERSGWGRAGGPRGALVAS
jgi:hypothetical protein